MFRLGIGVATTVLTLSMIAAPLNGAAAQPPDRKQKAAPAAPAARPAAPARPAGPPPGMARSAPVMRQAPPQRSAAPVFRQAPPPQRPAAAPRFVPQMTAPPRLSAPRTVAPAQRRAPDMQRAQPRQQFQQRQQSFQPSQLRAVPQGREAGRIQQQQQNVQQRLQQLQQQSGSGRLSRTERRELQQLRREDRRQQSAENNRKRLEQLQQQAKESQLSRNQNRELRRLERAQIRDGRRLSLQATGQQRLQKLREQAQQGRLNRAEQRELRQLRRAERSGRLGPRQQAREQSQLLARPARVTPQQVAQGRFASGFHGDKSKRRADRRAAWLAARAAWRLGLYAHYVPWHGPVYWPYAYNDIFYYTFWPDAYDDGYWAYAYDYFFDGIFFPDGAPYVEYAYLYEGPYDPVTTGSVPRRITRSAPGRVSQSTLEFCADQAKGITAWPFSQIEEAVQPTREQIELIEDLKKAAAEAAAQFREACPKSVPMTPPGRLQAITMRLQATLDAIKIVRPALVAFYNSLSDEQKARFNEIGPDLVTSRQRTTGGEAQSGQADCSGEKAGLSSLAIDRIEQIVQPNDAQSAALDRLDEAMEKAVATLREACPIATPQTPVGRLDVMQKRLEAMISASNTVRPALEDFYVSLDDEQKAKFNRLGRNTARSER